MYIKGPESWWIAKSITPQLVVNQSKINPQQPTVVVDLSSIIFKKHLLDRHFYKRKLHVKET